MGLTTIKKPAVGAMSMENIVFVDEVAMVKTLVRSKVESSAGRCWVLELAGCDLPTCRECSELEKARIAATWTMRRRAEIASGTLLPGKAK